jgi:microcystin-dependent protein
MRTVSDPINLANASGSNGQGIQGFSEWVPVYPGYAQLQSNTLTSVLTGNTVNLGTSLGDSMYITPAPGRSVYLNGTVVASNIVTTGTFTTTNINTVTASISSLTASTFTIGTTVFNNLTATTVNANTVNTTNENISGTLTAENRVRLSSGGSAGAGVTIGNTTGSPLDGNSLVVTGNIFTNSLSVGIGNIFASEINNLTAINGQPYPPLVPGSGIPAGAVMAWAAANSPTGWVLCDGTAYSSTNPVYALLFAAISTAYGVGAPGTFLVPDLRTRTIFGASTPGFQGDTTPWPNTIGAVSFSELQAEFSGTVVPNGTPGNGRGALAVKSIPVGFELAVGMRLQASSGSTDTAIHIIVAILNYQGGGGSYTNPNFPVLIINPPLSADTNASAQFTVTPVGPYNYRLSQPSDDNYYTQATTDVPAHTHNNKEGGTRSPIDNVPIDTTVSGAPTNASAQITQGVTTNFYYAVGSSTLGQPATVFNIGTSMNTRPSMVCMNYIIKL